MTLALDRIQQLAIGETPYHENRKYDMQNYFKDVVGVTVNENQRPEHIELFIDNRNAPYVITKPIHPSQQLIRKEKNGIVIHLKLQINFEFERVVLGFGREERCATSAAEVCPFRFLVVVLAREGPLRARLLGHRVLLGGEALAEFGIVDFDFVTGHGTILGAG